MAHFRRGRKSALPREAARAPESAAPAPADADADAQDLEPHDPEPRDPAAASAKVRLPLTIVAERDVLRKVGKLLDFAPHHVKEGLWTLHRPAIFTHEDELRVVLAGRTGGEPLPTWHDGTEGSFQLDTYVCRVTDVVHMPGFGVVIDGQGQLYGKTFAEARYFTPTLSGLPGVKVGPSGPVLRHRNDLRTLPAASVWVPWGGLFNYGHFLLDCLGSLAVLDEMGALERFPPIAPPLNAWQEELLSLYLGDRIDMVVRVSEPLVRIDDVVFASSMDHFLHAPNGTLNTVRERLLESARGRRPTPDGPRRIYLARDQDKRRMVNQDEIEARLAERGFVSVRPETLSIVEQILLFSQAEVVVGATGAGMANCMFMPPGAKVVEIQPSNFLGVWTRAFCHVLEIDWHGFFCESPLRKTNVFIEGQKRTDVLFEYEVPADDFLAFVDRLMT